ncbi:hypothetical protein PVA38_11520 [Streptococcus pneumoniae D39]|nr:hypothetical protein PVA38_11520 [Streptococcus pneumoniae D39]
MLPHNLLPLLDLVSFFSPLAFATYLSHHQWQSLDQLDNLGLLKICLLYTSPSPRDRTRSRMPSSA